MKRLSIVVLSVIILTACSSTHFIKNDITSYDEFNQRLKGKEVTLVLNNDEEMSGSNVVIRSNLTSVDDIHIPTKNINKITRTNQLTGSITGAIGGAIAGIAIGLLYGYAKNLEVSSPHLEYKPLEDMKGIRRHYQHNQMEKAYCW